MKCIPSAHKECASKDEINKFVENLIIVDVSLQESIDWNKRGEKTTKISIKPNYLNLEYNRYKIKNIYLKMNEI